MNPSEAKSAVKALYLQAAALAGLEVRAQSPERFVELVEDGMERVEESRRPEAVANLLKIVAATLLNAQLNGDTVLGENSVDAGKKDVCPVYPFDEFEPSDGRSR